MWFFWANEDEQNIWWSYTNHDRELDYLAEIEMQRYG